jgi:hypothetical protein
MANVLLSNTNIKFDRDARRTKTGLSRQSDEHWAIIQPSLDDDAFEDSQRN